MKTDPSFTAYFSLRFSLLIGLALSFSCAKNAGVAPGDLSSIIATMPPSIPTDGTSYFALAYGAQASDRTFLNNKILGYQAPGLSDVFNQWRRFSGGVLYNSASEITQTPAYCFTSFDSNRNWVNGYAADGTTVISPGTYTNCVNSDAFVSSSWSYIAAPDRIYNAANATNFNGFISGLRFSKFTSEAILSSTDTDDDGIGLVIAALIDSSNNVHTLTAMRTQGGMVPTQGWGIVYKRNNTVIQTFGEKSVGGTNRTGSTGDQLGWNGRRSKVRVERDGDTIRAYASLWVTGTTDPAVESTSEIALDLSNTSLGLSIFQGEQYYGYGTISQLASTFSSITFNTPNTEADATYIFDLANNSVYVKKTTEAGYQIVPGAAARSVIGFPKRVKNSETQKEFMINSATSYTDL